MADLPIRALDGHLFPLGPITTLTVIFGQPELTRENLRPMVAVTARIEGRGFSAVAADVRNVLGQARMLMAFPLLLLAMPVVIGLTAGKAGH